MGLPSLVTHLKVRVTSDCEQGGGWRGCLVGLAPLVTHLKVRVTSDCEQGAV